MFEGVREAWPQAGAEGRALRVPGDLTFEPVDVDFYPALSGARAVRRTMGEGATEYRQSQQSPLSSQAKAATPRLLCCDPDHSSLGNNVLGFVLIGGTSVLLGVMWGIL
jgi:hypothetical protein